MGLTRIRDLAAAALVVAVVSYLLVTGLYQWFPPLTVWTGLSLLGGAVAEAGWAFYLRAKIHHGQVGIGANRVHPLTVARAVALAKASAWVGAVTAGWWVGVLVYLLPKRSALAIPRADTPGAVVAALSALALAAAALWLQHCCKSPEDPPDDADTAAE